MFLTGTAMALTPEQKARRKIDRLLEQCGWIVQDQEEMNISAGPGVAVREFPLKSGHADYLLYADGKAIGVVEAKPEGYALTGVEIQSAKYTAGFPEHFPRWAMPLPFAYESTGAVTQFTNALDPDPRSREVFAFHRPEELVRLAGLGAAQLRAHLRAMPPLDTTKLWTKQVTAITNLEKALADNRPRSLIQMATGSGKQAEIVAEVSRRFSIIAAVAEEVEHGLRWAARLRQAMLKRAFEGKLVPQDPSDEPAADLANRLASATEKTSAFKTPARNRPKKLQTASLWAGEANGDGR